MNFSSKYHTPLPNLFKNSPFKSDLQQLRFKDIGQHRRYRWYSLAALRLQRHFVGYRVPVYMQRRQDRRQGDPLNVFFITLSSLELFFSSLFPPTLAGRLLHGDFSVRNPLHTVRKGNHTAGRH